MQWLESVVSLQARLVQLLPGSCCVWGGKGILVGTDNGLSPWELLPLMQIDRWKGQELDGAQGGARHGLRAGCLCHTPSLSRVSSCFALSLPSLPRNLCLIENQLCDVSL